MSKVVLFVSLTLDGVMQAPGRPDEDRRGGFEYGGWATRYADPEMGRAAGESMAAGAALLFGRRTYEDFYSVWPNRPEPNPFTDVLNNTRKYVASMTLKEPLPWMNSMLLAGDAVTAVARLRAEGDGDVVILGSGELAQSLMRHNLIDRYVLLLHPLVLGTGQKLFRDQGPRLVLRPVDSRITSTGVVVVTYVPAGPPAAG